MRIRWTVKGEQQVLQKMKRLASPEVSRAVRDVLNMAAEEVATIARQRVPVDTGALRSTIRAVPTKLIRGRIAVGVEAGGSIGSGGPVSPGVSPKTGKKAPAYVDYDRYVHEDLTARHDVGEAKFLERSLLLVWPHVKELCMEAIRKIARKG